ncbi:hypothetical protein CK203_009805 [Vitis vinifera]|uniref:Uncharacterized protein n=1 Tax=Vitis vinifera TaxID=29760 RepID=A0A438JVK1_VITVI|nr:hypothetical protein CK203_009805 [Vitis vinifera]
MTTLAFPFRQASCNGVSPFLLRASTILGCSLIISSTNSPCPNLEADVWFCCGDCDNNLVPFNGLVKELVSYRNSESSWLLFRENAGLNVKFQGRKTINGPPASVTSIQVKDDGRMTRTDVANITVLIVKVMLDGKIIHEHNNDPIVHKGQFILRNFYGKGRFSLQVIK